MKTCSYCGKAYPDESTVCPADGNALPDSFVERKKVTGVWRGVYGYGQREKRPGLEPAAFTLKLKQGWLSHFDGTCNDDAPNGVPGTGKIDGYFGSPKIEFTKQMPVGYVRNSDGTHMTLREYIIAEGNPCEHELSAPPVFYQGTFLDANRVQGTWLINAHTIRLADGTDMSLAASAGFWCAQFISADPKTQPTGGPTEPLFDKNLLSPKELEAVEGVAYVGLGTFNMAEAEDVIQLLIRENIRINVKQDDAAMAQTMPIQEITGGYSGTAQMVEIYVHPDDEADAKALIETDEPI